MKGMCAGVHVGSRVDVWWSEDRAWYPATVVSLETAHVTVEYDDGFVPPRPSRSELTTLLLVCTSDQNGTVLDMAEDWIRLSSLPKTTGTKRKKEEHKKAKTSADEAATADALRALDQAPAAAPPSPPLLPTAEFQAQLRDAAASPDLSAKDALLLSRQTEERNRRRQAEREAALAAASAASAAFAAAQARAAECIEAVEEETRAVAPLRERLSAKEKEVRAEHAELVRIVEEQRQQTAAAQAALDGSLRRLAAVLSLAHELEIDLSTAPCRGGRLISSR